MVFSRWRNVECKQRLSRRDVDRQVVPDIILGIRTCRGNNRKSPIEESWQYDIAADVLLTALKRGPLTTALKHKICFSHWSVFIAFSAFRTQIT